jgi:hypothetical protein
MEDKVRHDTLIGIEIAYRICLFPFIISHRKKMHFYKDGLSFQGRFVEHRLMLSSSFRCDQIQNCHWHDLANTLLCYLSLTYMFNKPTSSQQWFALLPWSGNAYWRGRLSTVDFIKEACFVQKVNNTFIMKGADLSLLVQGGQPYWAFPLQ